MMFMSSKAAYPSLYPEPWATLKMISMSPPCVSWTYFLNSRSTNCHHEKQISTLIWLSPSRNTWLIDWSIHSFIQKMLISSQQIYFFAKNWNIFTVSDDSIRMKQLCNTVKFNMKFISNWLFYYSVTSKICN